MRKIPQSAKPRGRPREFNITAALDSAVRVFRERGYNATSISDLEKATELASGSIYKAFKDKRALFLAAFNRYQTTHRDGLLIELEKGTTGREKLRHFLTFYASSSFGVEGEIGCMVLWSAIEIMRLDPELASIVKAVFKRIELQIEQLVRLGQADRSIAATVDCKGAARLMLCTVQGMRVVGKLGTKKAEMMDIVKCALKALD